MYGRFIATNRPLSPLLHLYTTEFAPCPRTRGSCTAVALLEQGVMMRRGVMMSSTAMRNGAAHSFRSKTSSVRRRDSMQHKAPCAMLLHWCAGIVVTRDNGFPSTVAAPRQSGNLDQRNGCQITVSLRGNPKTLSVFRVFGKKLLMTHGSCKKDGLNRCLYFCAFQLQLEKNSRKHL